MIIVISPAKSLDFESKVNTRKFSQPEFLDDSKQLISELKKLSPDDIAELMNISAKLAELNYSRFANWTLPFEPDNAKQAIFAFTGDVYLGLNSEEFSSSDLNFAQKHLRILSGLYGLLKPLDLIQAYRLEMGSRFKNKKGNNLYEFWGSKLTETINNQLANSRDKLLINLASKEYFGSIKTSSIDGEIISPVFKDYSKGKYKIISFYAKKARGFMSAYLIKNKISSAKHLLDFNTEGYRYSKQDSTPSQPVFLRKLS
ncbi:MAG: peroxide stress protein YaaA [SAR86 cluster bacterium]|uniref:UPF0246 protein COC19_01415 n=1 Tax=SAR86 cluster bacterium TaxID=2030880 RepID=A0A2A4MT04_9GAMM|nr:MAG: peroxide stress protein YaaA [SAR86 cluster bacterium]